MKKFLNSLKINYLNIRNMFKYLKLFIYLVKLIMAIKNYNIWKKGIKFIKIKIFLYIKNLN